MIKIGIIGAGKKLKNHLEILKNIDGVKVAGIFSFDKEHAGDIAMESNIPFFYKIEELIGSVNGIDIIETNHLYHASVEAIKQSKHLFINEPLMLRANEFENLIKLVHEADVKIQVKHPYSSNTALMSACSYIRHPQFIEMAHYFKNKNNNCNVSDVNQFLIYDISLLLSIVNSCVQRVHSHGFSIKGNCPDVVNARIEFGNGGIANVTSSRLAVTEKHKYLIYQQNELVVINLTDNKSVIYNYKNTDDNLMPHEKNIFNTPPLNCIKDSTKSALKGFCDFIEKGRAPLVGFENFYHALQLSCEIIEKINRNSVQMAEY